jgi:hypothetical protein
MARKKKEAEVETIEIVEEAPKAPEAKGPQALTYPRTSFADGAKVSGQAQAGYVDTAGTKYENMTVLAKGKDDGAGGTLPKDPDQENGNSAAYFSDTALDPYEQAHANDSYDLPHANDF